MARTFNGSTQYLSATSSLLANEPIDFVVHANADVLTATMTAVGLGNTGAATGAYQMAVLGATVGDPANASKQSDAGTASAALSSPGGLVVSTWAVLGAKYVSDTSRDVFLDGGNKASSATNVTDPTPESISIGAVVRSSVSNYFDGSIAEAYVLDANMTDAQHAIVGTGISPIWIMPLSNIRAWYPLLGDNNNRVGNGYPDLTATGSPATSDHPANIVYPRINGVITV